MQKHLGTQIGSGAACVRLRERAHSRQRHTGGKQTQRSGHHSAPARASEDVEQGGSCQRGKVCGVVEPRLGPIDCEWRTSNFPPQAVTITAPFTAGHAVTQAARARALA